MALRDRADSILKRATERGDIPGVVAMATNREETLYEGAFGQRIQGQQTAMSADTVCWIASMTKALTGAAVMREVERGTLDLESPASRWAPELAQIPVLEGLDAADQPRTRPARRTITLRHLLTHTAGFGYTIWNELLGKYHAALGIPSAGSGKRAGLRSPLLFDPGERWNYGIGIDWAGQVLEAATGKKLGAYMREHLFEPLGMQDSGFKITPAMRQRLAKVHQRGADGKLAPVDFEVTQDPEFEPGGGGLYSTAGDYLRFVRMILNGGQANGVQVLKPETVREMSRNHMGALNVTLLKTAVPATSNDAEFFPGVAKKWGLTFMINTGAAPTGRSPGSLAWAGLANTYFWIDPAKGLGGVFLSQVFPFVDQHALPLFYEFEQAVYQAA
jgi:CubicO group peptidase (beta-lactamase class C family)